MGQCFTNNVIAQAAGVKSTPARVVITARSIPTSIIVCGSSKEAIVLLDLGIKVIVIRAHSRMLSIVKGGT